MHLCEKMLLLTIYLKIFRCFYRYSIHLKTHCLRSIRHLAFQSWSLLSEAVFVCASSLLYHTVYLQTGPAPEHGP